jgi:Homeodomain-like domain
MARYGDLPAALLGRPASACFKNPSTSRCAVPSSCSSCSPPAMLPRTWRLWCSVTKLAVLRRQVPRPRLEPADRALLAAVSRALPRARWSCFLVKPETLMCWHRRLVAGAWTYPRRGQGRPPLDQDVQQLIVRLARENSHWGYQRIQGELLRLGVGVSATAIRSTLRRRGLDPAPRRTTMTWQALLPSRPPGSWPVTSSPSTRSGSSGCRCCSSSKWTPDGFTSAA